MSLHVYLNVNISIVYSNKICINEFEIINVMYIAYMAGANY